MRKIWKSTTAALVFSLFLTGCGSTNQQTVPELMEPVATNAAYRPVEYGDVGQLTVLVGTVVPTDYCHFFETSVTVSEILVEVGDRVKKGDVLAYANTAAAKEELKALRGDLEKENSIYQINFQISDRKIAQLNYEIKNLVKNDADTGTSGETEITESDKPSIDSDTDDIPENEISANQESPGAAIKELNSQIQILKENARYDKLLHEYRVGKLNESIAAKEKIVEDGTIRAKHAGQVTYTKNLAAGREASGNENIVIVSDKKERYIELKDMTVNNYTAYENCEVKYISRAGKKLPVKELSYTSDELILAKANNTYPNVRLSCPKAGKLTYGENYLVYYQKEDVQDVLVVGNDSIYMEENSTFVYVQNDSGEKERRQVVLGAKGSNYTEVKQGLSEGELVYYESKERMPVDYGTYTVAYSDFERQNYASSYARCSTVGFPYTSEYEGTVTKVVVESNQEVQKGDLLCVIDTGEGKAALKDAQNQIERENSSYQETIKSYDEQIAAAENKYEKEILSLEKKLAGINHNDTLSQLQEILGSIQKNNDGTGKVSVYAKSDGIVGKVTVSVENQVEKGDELMTISETSGNLMLMEMKAAPNAKNFTDDLADIGEKLTMTVGGKTYTGTCVGNAVDFDNARKVYLTSDKKGAKLSTSSQSGYSDPAFFVKMDEEEFYEEVPAGGKIYFSYVNVKKVCAIPTSMIYKESRVESGGKEFFYVWRVVDGKLVKQYIQTDPQGSLADDRMTVVLSGLNAGDVIASGNK